VSNWSILLVKQMSKNMCKKLVPLILEKAGFEPPKIRQFNLSGESYYEHNSFYNYVIGFVGE